MLKKLLSRFRKAKVVDLQEVREEKEKVVEVVTPEPVVVEPVSYLYDYSPIKEMLINNNKEAIENMSKYFVSIDDFMTCALAELKLPETSGSTLGVALAKSLFAESFGDALLDYQTAAWNLAKLKMEENKFILGLIAKAEQYQQRGDYAIFESTHSFIMLCLYNLARK